MKKLNLDLIIAICTASIVYFYWRIRLKKKGKRFTIKKIIFFTLFFMLSLSKLTVENDIFTMFGGTNENGSVISLMGIHQKAKDNCISILPSFYQKAGKNAITVLGFAGYQDAPRNSIYFGVSLIQQ
jgi:hypothetical protein